MRSLFGLFAEDGVTHPSKELGSFFHDGQVGGKVVVQYFKSGPPHGPVKFSGDKAAGRHAKFLADGDPYRRRNNADNRQVPRVQFRDDLVHRVDGLIGSAEGTVDQTLPAMETTFPIDAVGCSEHPLNRTRWTMTLASVAPLAAGALDGEHAGNLPLLICFGQDAHAPTPGMK